MAKETLKFNNDKFATATVTAVKGSMQKIGIIGRMIAKMKVDQALLQLQFCARRQSKEMYTLLNSAIANAENNHGLDLDNLYVSEVLVGKAFNMKRFSARGRGRSSKINKPFSRITIKVSEKE